MPLPGPTHYPHTPPATIHRYNDHYYWLYVAWVGCLAIPVTTFLPPTYPFAFPIRN